MEGNAYILPSQRANTFRGQRGVTTVAQGKPFKLGPREANPQQARAETEPNVLIVNTPAALPLYRRVSVREPACYDPTAFSGDAGGVAEIQNHLAKTRPLLGFCYIEREVLKGIDLHDLTI